MGASSVPRNGSDANSATISLGYTQALLQQAQPQGVAAPALGRAPGDLVLPRVLAFNIEPELIASGQVYHAGGEGRFLRVRDCFAIPEAERERVSSVGLALRGSRDSRSERPDRHAHAGPGEVKAHGAELQPLPIGQSH